MMTTLSALLLDWYRSNGRRLPWRGHPDPYAVWVSEIMLQQTRVEAVIPYFERWMARFPTVSALAAASEQDVLAVWEGLGYYSRARNLHRAARQLVEAHGGELPRSVTELRALPGIGRYTAGAIASMAFGLDEPTLDGNLRRVFARLFDLDLPADSPEGERRLWALAGKHLPSGRAGDYNQALMDLGATICLPKNPRCLLCPLTGICLARQRGTQAGRPVLRPKAVVPEHVQAAAVIARRGRVLLARRPSHGLLGGMWEFPNGRVPPGANPADSLAGLLETGYGLQIAPGQALGLVRHAYTHFRVEVHAFRADLLGGTPVGLRWVDPGELDDLPMGKVDRRIAGMWSGEV